MTFNLRLLSRDLGIAADVCLNELTIENWVAIFRFIAHAVPHYKANLAFGRKMER